MMTHNGFQHDATVLFPFSGLFLHLAAEENIEGDNPLIGIILSKDKDKLLVEYTTYGIGSELFVQKYQLYLPNEEALRHQMELTLAEQEKINEDE